MPNPAKSLKQRRINDHDFAGFEPDRPLDCVVYFMTLEALARARSAIPRIGRDRPRMRLAGQHSRSRGVWAAPGTAALSLPVPISCLLLAFLSIQVSGKHFRQALDGFARLKPIKNDVSRLRIIFDLHRVVHGIWEADNMVPLCTRQRPVKPPALAVQGVVVNFNRVVCLSS